jgi:hypothetical protein
VKLKSIILQLTFKVLVLKWVSIILHNFIPTQIST